MDKIRKKTKEATKVHKEYSTTLSTYLSASASWELLS